MPYGKMSLHFHLESKYGEIIVIVNDDCQAMIDVVTKAGDRKTCVEYRSIGPTYLAQVQQALDLGEEDALLQACLQSLADNYSLGKLFR